MGSLSYLQPEKRGTTHEVHQLASLGVRLLDSGDIGITIQDIATSSLVTEVKERQYEDPVLVHYRDTTPHKEKKPFEISKDGVLRYEGRLCVPYVAGLRRQVLGETRYSRYSIHPGATKMYHDIREVYWWDGMKKDIVEFVAQWPNWWFDVGETTLVGLELVQQAIEKIKLIQKRLLAVQIRQKSYADNRRRDLEFQVDDWVFLKVSPMKGVMRFEEIRKVKAKMEETGVAQGMTRTDRVYTPENLGGTCKETVSKPTVT
ncbi:uncharacterized protein [Nicotiana tomentosiformis]|uniref:uncharacterized protein n=1 Tax=Nicotiana tomentosiformis TaxID=4098 RepID=UPI00388CC4A0